MDTTLDSRIFPAKLLLFGEHVLLLGATALAVPVPAFGGRWAWSEYRDRHHGRLMQFAQSEALKSVEVLDTEQFEQDLKAGLIFQSDIPTGYGLGSSGALCAAIYARYSTEHISDLRKLKSIFAQMEGFFHGNSSGIDPLTSFVGEPILIQNKTEVSLASPRAWGADSPCVFLLDSRLPRRTGPLVSWFLAQSEEPGFARKLTEDYLPMHEAALRGWLTADADLFWPNLRRISAFQLEHFSPMVPDTLKRFWEKDIDNQGLVLKICGAGGGGFVLGFARELELAQKATTEFELLFPF